MQITVGCSLVQGQLQISKFLAVCELSVRSSKHIDITLGFGPPCTLPVPVFYEALVGYVLCPGGLRPSCCPSCTLALLQRYFQNLEILHTKIIQMKIQLKVDKAKCLVKKTKKFFKAENKQAEDHEEEGNLWRRTVFTQPLGCINQIIILPSITQTFITRVLNLSLCNTDVRQSRQPHADHFFILN